MQTVKKYKVYCGAGEFFELGRMLPLPGAMKPTRSSSSSSLTQLGRLKGRDMSELMRYYGQFGNANGIRNDRPVASNVEWRRCYPRLN